ncbi:MAG: sulfatase-like hydrolase/transferase [Polyangiaceae bacterium]|nr:sulfatase-like hydrolase/transferase [Polyangiaceae bacterium]
MPTSTPPEGPLAGEREPPPPVAAAEPHTAAPEPAPALRPSLPPDGNWRALASEKVALALSAAFVAAVPTALRAQGALFDGWLGATALTAFLLVPVALLHDRARRGYRSLVGRDAPRHLAAGLALWAGLSTTLFTLLASLLKAHTNHRALAGATFAVVGLGAAAAVAIVVPRLVRLGARRLSRPVALGALALLALGPLALLSLPLLGAGLGAEERATRAALTDGVLVLAAASLLFAVRLPRSLARPAQLAAFPLAALVVVGGVVRLEHSGRALQSAGGLAAACLEALERWTDHDADGYGAHFGGRDCDDGDARRHPGADEVPGDGIDNDCDGEEALAELAALPPTPTTAPPAPGGSGAPAPSPSATAPVAARPDAPDVVLVTLDSVRADHTSAYGYGKATTPTLEALAARGTWFAHAYAAGGDTQHALLPLVSCRTFTDTAKDDAEWPTVRDAVDTLAERLRRVGYQTGAVGSFTWLRRDRGFDQGFDHFSEEPFRRESPERGTTGEHAVAAATEIYGRMQGDRRPLFLWVHLFDAHEKYLSHEGLDFGKGEEGRYDGEIAFVDRQLGKLVELVDRGPRAARTAWLVHGSIGESFGEHGKKGRGELYEELLRVPLVVAPPRGPAGRYTRAAVSVLDLGPTVLDLAGAPLAETAGVSLLAIAAGDLERGHPPVFAAAERRVAVVDWPLKLLVKRTQKRDRLLLFDLDADPREARDLAEERPQDLKRLDALRQRGPGAEKAGASGD